MAKDYLVRATAANEELRAFAITSRELVETARVKHEMSPVAIDALGRLLTAGAMMGVMMKGEEDILTVNMNGDGPIHGVTVTANSKGEVKGFVGNPSLVIPPNYGGKFDVGAAIGYGTLTVIKDLGLKEPYNSQTPLGTSEVAEDLTYYFATSEQIPSVVALGITLNKDGSVKTAGGFIIQAMPFVSDEVLDKLEAKIGEIKSVNAFFEKGMSPEEILEEILGDMGRLEFTDTIEPKFLCDCNRKKVQKALISLGRKELQTIAEEGKDVELVCHFCNKKYNFTPDEVYNLMAEATRD